MCIITHSAKTGNLIVPADLLSGSYKLTVTAEDTAHNLDSQEATMEVLPWVTAGGY